MAAVAVEAVVVLAEGLGAVVACRDLLAEQRLAHRAACPEHQDLLSAALHRLIDRVLELLVPTQELQAGRDLQYSRELAPTLAPGRDWPGPEASALDHRLYRRHAPPPGSVQGQALDLGHQRLRQLVQDLESQRESELEQGSPIVRATRYQGLEVATQDLVFPIRGPDFRNARPIVRRLWRTAEAV
jgi:hypothetical protein